MLPFFAHAKLMVLDEVNHIQGFMLLLMKPRNGGEWVPEDKEALRRHLKRLARTLPALGVFALPGGSLLLPLLAIFLDRRKARNRAPLMHGVARNAADAAPSHNQALSASGSTSSNPDAVD
jgi:hypothetical protein